MMQPNKVMKLTGVLLLLSVLLMSFMFHPVFADEYDENENNTVETPIVLNQEDDHTETPDAVENVNTADETEPSEEEVPENPTDDGNRRKMVILGDSYGTGYNPDGGVDPETEAWPAQVISSVGSVDSINVSMNGVGFVRSIDGENFSTLLDLAHQKVTDPLSVEILIVGGGYNDQYYDDSTIEQAVEQFIEQAKELFPNATVCIAMLGWSNGNPWTQQHVLNTVLPAYQRAAVSCGAQYVSGSEYVLANSSGAFSSDNFHPNTIGQTLLAEFIERTVLNENNSTGLFKVDGQWVWLENGIINEEVTGLKWNEYGLWYLRNGKVDFGFSGVATNDSGWWYVEAGQVTFQKNDIIKIVAHTDPNSSGEEAWWYVSGSKFTNTETVAKNSKGWWYVKDGKVDFTYTGVKKNSKGWWAIQNGKVNFNFNGFLPNENGWWYLEKGQVSFQKNDIIKGTANIDPEAAGQQGWWYVQNGCVTDAETVAKNANGWWYVKAGKVDFSYNGFAKNSNGWWYVDKGQVTFKRNDILQGTAAVSVDDEEEEAWWYIKGSKVTDAETIAKNASGWWYVKDGKIDFTHTGIEKNENGWWRIENGAVNFGFNGFAKNSNGWWYVEKGRVTLKRNDILQGTAATSLDNEEEEAWWYIRGSKVTDAETVAKNSNGWWYVKDGKVDFSYTGIKKNENGWWRIVNGHVDFGCNSVEENEYGWWYIKGGKVDFSYTGLAKNSDGWWYIKGDKVDFTYNGLAYHKGDWYYMEDGKLNWEYNGKASISGYPRQFTVMNGKLSGGLVAPTAALAKRADSILNSVGWNLPAAFNWCARMQYRSYIENGSPGVAHFANYGFANYRGNCYVYAAMFVCLARELGYEAYQISGHVRLANGGLHPHSWTEVKIGNTFYVFDPNFSNERYGHNNGYQIYYGKKGTWQYAEYYRMGN